MSVLTLISDLGEAVDYFVRGLAGWRYLFSPSFRAKVQARWRAGRRHAAIFEAFGFFLGVAFTLLLMAWVLYSLFEPARL